MVTATQMNALRLRMSRSIGDSITLMLVFGNLPKVLWKISKSVLPPQAPGDGAIPLMPSGKQQA